MRRMRRFEVATKLSSYPYPVFRLVFRPFSTR